jgi:hypothetical protein
MNDGDDEQRTMGKMNNGDEPDDEQWGRRTAGMANDEDEAWGMGPNEAWASFGPQVSFCLLYTLFLFQLTYAFIKYRFLLTYNDTRPPHHPPSPA